MQDHPKKKREHSFQNYHQLPFNIILTKGKTFWHFLSDSVANKDFLKRTEFVRGADSID